MTLATSSAEKKNGMVSSRPSRKEKWTGFIQTIEKRKMDGFHPDHQGNKNGLVASRPSRKENRNQESKANINTRMLTHMDGRLRNRAF